MILQYTMHMDPNRFPEPEKFNVSDLETHNRPRAII